MPLNRAEVDRLIDTHFQYEATDDVEGVVSSLAEGAEHHVVPSPVGITTDREAIRAFYAGMFKDLRGSSVTPVRRLYGENFAVDEAIWHGHIEDGRLFGCPGRSGQVDFRLLHVFEFDGGKIRRENVWCDLAAIQAQLGVGETSQ
ncbi:MAG: nuclear transport factor 2 family protein [Ramlibacter sp.]